MKRMILFGLLLLSTSAWSQQINHELRLANSKETIQIILERIHRIYGGVQALRDTMSENGATTFRDIYGISGAGVNEGDIEGCGQTIYCYPDVGDKSVGFNFLPYELRMSRDGYFYGKIAVFRAKDMKKKTRRVYRDSILNGFTILEFEWDIDKDEINTYRVTLGEIDIRLGLFEKNGSWVQLKFGAGIGGEFRSLPTDIGKRTNPYGQNYSGSSDNYFLRGGAGIEFHVALSNAFSLHGQTLYQVAGMIGTHTSEGNKADGQLTRGRGLRTSLTSQVELNYEFNSPVVPYKSSAGIYIQSQNLQTDLMNRGGEVIDVSRRDRDGHGNQVTGGLQIKW